MIWNRPRWGWWQWTAKLQPGRLAGTMNLKEAAHHLGVHYQTAYKWVRGGELVAVRVGGRYEVSPAAIQRFEAARTAVVGQGQLIAAPAVFGSLEIDPEDLIEELEALVIDPFVAFPAIVALVARRGAAVLGDTCLAGVYDEDGRPLYQCVDHPNPDQAAILTGALHLTNGRPAPFGGIAMRAFTEQRVIRIPHVPQDWLRRSVRPELLQHLGRCPMHSVLGAPVIVEGASVGVVVFTRDTPNHPYTELDASYVQRLADRMALLYQSAQEIEAVWELRAELVKRLTQVVRSYPPESATSAGAIGDVLQATPGARDIPVAIFDHAGYVLAMNEPARRASGYDDDTLVGKTFEAFTHPADIERERANFGRLLSGELDYLDILVRRVLAGERVSAFVSHRAAVHDVDATLRLIISVFRPARVAKDSGDPLTLETISSH